MSLYVELKPGQTPSINGARLTVERRVKITLLDQATVVLPNGTVKPPATVLTDNGPPAV
jgi:flagellar biosynthesis regulator FlbT